MVDSTDLGANDRGAVEIDDTCVVDRGEGRGEGRAGNRAVRRHGGHVVTEERGHSEAVHQFVTEQADVAARRAEVEVPVDAGLRASAGVGIDAAAVVVAVPEDDLSPGAGGSEGRAVVADVCRVAVGGAGEVAGAAFVEEDLNAGVPAPGGLEDGFELVEHGVHGGAVGGTADGIEPGAASLEEGHEIDGPSRGGASRDGGGED